MGDACIALRSGACCGAAGGRPGSRHRWSAAPARAEHLKRRQAIRRRHARARDRQPERRPPARPGADPLPPRPPGDGAGAGGRDRRGAPGGEDRLGGQAGAGRRPAHHRLAARPEPRSPHLPAALPGQGKKRGPARLRLRGAAGAPADERPRRADPRRRGLVPAAELPPGRAGRRLDRDRRAVRAHPVPLLPEPGLAGHPRHLHERGQPDLLGAARLAREPKRPAYAARADPAHRLLVERRLLPARHNLGREDWLRAAGGAGSVARGPRRGHRPDQHLAGVQLPRRDRRRLGRLVVHRRRQPVRRPAPALRRSRSPLPLPRLERLFLRLAAAERQDGGLPLR